MENRLKKNIAELTRITVEDFRSAPKLRVRVMADSVRSMNNVGSLLRTCDAFGVEELVLCGISGCPPHPEISKTALGADESVKWSYEEDAPAAVRRMKSEGWRICVLEQTHGSVALQDFRLRRDERYLIVVGNEVDGVDQRIVDESDVALEIPQVGTKHSLNVAVSGGIAIWEFFKQLGLE